VKRKRISATECGRLIGESPRAADEDIERLIDAAYSLAELITEEYNKRNRKDERGAEESPCEVWSSDLHASVE
jgi:hypothetical protein